MGAWIRRERAPAGMLPEAALVRLAPHKLLDRESLEDEAQIFDFRREICVFDEMSTFCI